MQRFARVRPTPALFVAMIALVVALSGVATALPGKNKVSANDIKNSAVTQKKIKKGAVRSKQIKGKSIRGNRLRDRAVTAKQIKDATITSRQVATDGLNSSNMSDYEVLGASGLVRVAATEGATEAAAQAAAPETELFSKGQVSIYAKCFRDTGASAIHGEIYARTTANGAILQGADAHPASDATLLDAATPEEQAEVQTLTEGTADAGSVAEGEGVLIAADGTDLHLLTHIAVKQGTFPSGNGAFGDGNVCLFGGAVTG